MKTKIAKTLVQKTFGRRLEFQSSLFQVIQYEIVADVTFKPLIKADHRRVYLELAPQFGGLTVQFGWRSFGATHNGVGADTESKNPWIRTTENSFSLPQNGLELKGGFGPITLVVTEVLYIGG